MDNAQNMLESILSDPDAMSKIRDLSKQLGLGSSDESDNSFGTQPQTTQNPQQRSSSEFSPFDLSSLTSLLSGTSKPQTENSVNPDILGAVMKFMPMINSLRTEDESTALLNALRPFLSQQKRQRLDEASKMLRIMRLLPMIKSTGLLS